DGNREGVGEGEGMERGWLDRSNQGGLLDREVKRRGGNTDDWRKWDADLQAEASVQAVRGGGKGDVTKTHVLWNVKSKSVDHVVSPLLVDGRLLLIKKGLAACLDAKKGKPLREEERRGDAGHRQAAPA